MNNSETWYCYIIKSMDPKYLNYTYNGSTNDIVRRLRQHNGEIKGGAFRTKIRRPWEYIAILGGLPNHHNALSCEWKIRHPTGCARSRKPKEFIGVKGRIASLNKVLKLDKWTNQCKELNKDIPKLDLWIKREYSEYLDKNFPNNIAIHVVDRVGKDELYQKP